MLLQASIVRRATALGPAGPRVAAHHASAREGSAREDGSIPFVPNCTPCDAANEARVRCGTLAAMRLLILGGGFTGSAVARQAVARGLAVHATTRDPARGAQLSALGVTPIVVASLGEAGGAAPLGIDADTRVLVTIPPDAGADRALAARLADAHSVAYVSSSVVYGDAHGRVDEETPTVAASASALAAATPRARARVEAEAIYRELGATIVRAPAIYGPGRGVHLRVARGTLRVAGDGHNVVSRVHVDDLASALLELLVRGTRDALFVSGDRLPAPHVEVIRFVCDALKLPMPPHVPAEQADETLRHERALDPSHLYATLGREPRFPTYREGFAQCMAADGL
jgi:nucleoside-diphosphate-sugar epimerase